MLNLRILLCLGVCEPKSCMWWKNMPDIKCHKITMFIVISAMIADLLFPKIGAAESQIPIIQPSQKITKTSAIFSEKRLPKAADAEPRKVVHVTVTAYSSTVDQSDSTPFITASGTFVRDGIIAANFLPIGTKIRFPDYSGKKIFAVEDRMNPRYYRRADIWMPSREQAKQFGVKRLKMEIF